MTERYKVEEDTGMFAPSRDFKRRINELINQGWIPLGGMTIMKENTRRRCYQALYLPLYMDVEGQ